MNVTTTFAKLAGIRRALAAFLDAEDSKVRRQGNQRLIMDFEVLPVEHYFRQTANHVQVCWRRPKFEPRMRVVPTEN